MKTKYTITQALDQYFAVVKRTQRESSYKVVRSILRGWHRRIKVDALEELASHYYNNKYIPTFPERSRQQYVCYLRKFLEWAQEHYRVPLAIPPSYRVRHYNDRGVRFASGKVRAMLWRKEVLQAWSLCVRPHQQAFFLFGYLYGWSMRRIVRLEWSDLTTMEVPPYLYSLLDVIRPVQHTTRVFGQWFAKNNHSKVWQGWVGNIPFHHINLMGSLARVESAMLPTKAFAFVVSAYVAQLRPASAEGLERVVEKLKAGSSG